MTVTGYVIALLLMHHSYYEKITEYQPHLVVNVYAHIKVTSRKDFVNARFFTSRMRSLDVIPAHHCHLSSVL